MTIVVYTTCSSGEDPLSLDTQRIFLDPAVAKEQLKRDYKCVVDQVSRYGEIESTLSDNAYEVKLIEDDCTTIYKGILWEHNI